MKGEYEIERHERWFRPCLYETRKEKKGCDKVGQTLNIKPYSKDNQDKTMV